MSQLAWCDCVTVTKSIFFLSLLALSSCGSDEDLSQKVASMAAVQPAELQQFVDEAQDESQTQAAENPPKDFLQLCEGVSGDQRRMLLSELGKFGAQGFGKRALEPATLSGSPEKCVLGLLPAALYTNLRTGVPASILVSQAIQETGWCRSELAIKGRNMHGQKSKFSKSFFSFWPGDSLVILSTEDPSGEGNKIASRFMKFNHVDHSFYSVAERFLVPGLPYKACLSRRSNSAEFIKCVGQHWAVHTDYAQVVLQHRANFRSASRPNLRLNRCDLPVTDWSLHQKFNTP